MLLLLCYYFIISNRFHLSHPNLPFGGIGHSGMGRYLGKYTFETFSHNKPVFRKRRLWDFGLLSDHKLTEPPFTDSKLKMVKMLV